MSTLLLRLAGPMQSWGTQSRFTVRDTGLEPSKSGVIGLLCAALGRPRWESVQDLAALHMGVRVDHEGSMKLDFHTAGGGTIGGRPYGVARASGGVTNNAVTSNRYYLADADFLVALEGDAGLLQQLSDALERPVWPLFLGRKAFVPGEPIRLADGLRADCDLLVALTSYPWQPRPVSEKPPDRLRLVLESTPPDGEPRNDLPLSFAERRFTLRYVRTAWMDVSTAILAKEVQDVLEQANSQSAFAAGAQ